MKFVTNKLDGGEVSSEGSKTFPGGGAIQRAHGGQQTVENVTGNFEIVPDRDLEDIKYCEARVGKDDAQLTEHRIDRDGKIVGRQNFWTGKLSRFNPGSYDANSSDPREA